jgi:hypothetical protein
VEPELFEELELPVPEEHAASTSAAAVTATVAMPARRNLRERNIGTPHLSDDCGDKFLEKSGCQPKMASLKERASAVDKRAKF